MARTRAKTGSLAFQIKANLDGKLRIGESKCFAKAMGTAQEGIYSWDTYRSYLKHCNYFADYCRTEHGCRTLEECRPYAEEWVRRRIDQGLSPYTVKLEVSALGKLYGEPGSNFGPSPSRHRAEITRSRGVAVRDKNFSETKNDRFVQFCRSTGLRRSELMALTGDKLVKRDNQYYIHVTNGTKGGRERFAPVIGNVKNVVELMRAAGTGKVFQKIYSNADIHGYRSEYAVTVYQSHARDITTLSRREIYYCRGDLKGVRYDRAAMAVTSQALGHNRISVIAGHYLR